MDHQMIGPLLDKYFEGLTDLEEENRLRQAALHGPWPEQLQAYRPLFRYLGGQQQAVPALSSDFDEQLLAKLDRQAAAAAKTRQLPYRSWALRAAAAFALALGAFWLYQPAAPAQEVAVVDWSKYEVKTPEEAFRVTRSALRTVSSKLNEGTSVAAQGFDENLGQIKKFMRY